MKFSIKLILTFFVLTFCWNQSFSQQVTIQGKVFDPTGINDFFNLVIVNKRIGNGKFGNADGTFKITAEKNDTLIIGSLGYKTLKISMTDSSEKSVYNVKIPLSKIKFDLRPAEVFAERSLKDIHEELGKLEFKESEYMLSGLDAMRSPITFLYQEFSRREQQKRLAYELIIEDKRRQALRELFAQYVDQDIIQLDDDDFDLFIDYCNPSAAFIRRSTQYEFVVYIKAKYYQFLEDYHR